MRKQYNATRESILEYIQSTPLNDLYLSLPEEGQRLFFESISKLIMRHDFMDLRFAEILEEKEGAKPFKIVPYKDFTTTHKAYALEFLWKMLFEGRIIKLYQHEFAALSEQLKSFLIYDKDYFNKLNTSVTYGDKIED